MIRWISLLLVISCASCSRNNKSIVEKSFADSLLLNYHLPESAKAIEGDLQFWKTRSLQQEDNFVAKAKYAQALTSRFRLYNNIVDLQAADSIISGLVKANPEPGNLLSLAGIKMLQHKFSEASSLIQKVNEMKAEPFAVRMLQMDANFELGNYNDAKLALASVKSRSDYAYNFRMAKLDHYNGSLDSAIAHMSKAASVAATVYLKTAALSNLADLYLHAGKLKKAYQLYKECIKSNAADFHSISQLGWIALVHDRNDSLAKKLFQLVYQYSKNPDALLKLAITSELTNKKLAIENANLFIKIVNDSLHGNMYNKYLIELYTGILQEAEEAVSVAKKEIQNRATPQTYAWLSWSLTANGQAEEAYKIYEEHVSGKPLEGLELFWMGKMMKALNKGYNAHQYFKAAEKNRYDLSPSMANELKNYLD